MIARTERGAHGARRDERPGRRRVLLAALTAPAVWILHLLLSYLAVSVACETRAFGPVIAGLSVAEGVLVLLTALATVAVVLGGRAGYLIWRWSEVGIKAKGGEEQDRQGFMGLVGVVLSALFLFGLLLGGAPPFFLLLRSCGA